jgi:Zn-dependent peptidase ImmA (M78 family)
MQRSFAAELLSPFEEVIVALDGDYSDDAQQEVAESFDVSPLTIRTMLVNNGRIERNEMGEDLGAIGLSI